MPLLEAVLGLLVRVVLLLRVVVGEVGVGRRPGRSGGRGSSGRGGLEVDLVGLVATGGKLIWD